MYGALFDAHISGYNGTHPYNMPYNAVQYNAVQATLGVSMGDISVSKWVSGWVSE